MNAIAPPVVLVAEDNEFDRMIVAEAFNEIGMKLAVRFVQDGQAVLDYLHRRDAYAHAEAAPTPAILLLDLNMPRMTGNEAMLVLRSDPAWRLLPIVVLSTSDNERQIAQAYADGANGFMSKPARFDDFVALLRAFADFWFGAASLPTLPLPV